jgi:hypothetical protein
LTETLPQVPTATFQKIVTCSSAKDSNYPRSLGTNASHFDLDLAKLVHLCPCVDILAGLSFYLLLFNAFFLYLTTFFLIDMKLAVSVRRWLAPIANIPAPLNHCQ